jgi:hypothetical protein
VGAESTNFSVFRLRRDVFTRSSIGLLYQYRSQSLAGAHPNNALGFDGSFGVTDELSLVGWYARTHNGSLNTLDLGDNNSSYRAQINYSADLFGASADYMLVDDGFNPEIGFVRRRDFKQTTGNVRYSPRPDISWIRQISFSADIDYLENDQTGVKESFGYGGGFGAELENSDRFNLGWAYSYEYFVQNENISGATIAAGEYDNPEWRVSYTMGPQRGYQGSLSLRRGDYYDGTITSVGLNQGRIEVTQQVSVEPSVSLNWIDLPQGHFDQNVFVTRVTYTMTPRMYVSGLVQAVAGNDFDFGNFSGNFRFRWEWAPGSELFLVYTEDRNAAVPGTWSGLNNRGLVLKINRLLRI